MTGNTNILWWNFYNPVYQNDRQRESSSLQYKNNVLTQLTPLLSFLF